MNRRVSVSNILFQFLISHVKRGLACFYAEIIQPDLLDPHCVCGGVGCQLVPVAQTTFTSPEDETAVLPVVGGVLQPGVGPHRGRVKTGCG